MRREMLNAVNVTLCVLFVDILIHLNSYRFIFVRSECVWAFRSFNRSWSELQPLLELRDHELFQLIERISNTATGSRRRVGGAPIEKTLDRFLVTRDNFDLDEDGVSLSVHEIKVSGVKPRMRSHGSASLLEASK